jgi:hypothetical protein
MFEFDHNQIAAVCFCCLALARKSVSTMPPFFLLLTLLPVVWEMVKLSMTDSSSSASRRRWRERLVASVEETG